MCKDTHFDSTESIITGRIFSDEIKQNKCKIYLYAHILIMYVSNF